MRPMVMRLYAVLVALVPSFVANASGQVKVPDTPAGQKLIAWLDVFNRGDRAAYKDFLAEFPLPHLNASELIASVRKKLEQEAAAGGFAGAVLIARNGELVLADAYGLSDRERRTPNELKTRFRVGSMNKMFTATATLQLVQAGKLGLDDPLGKYLTDYPNKDVATKVTIHHLLTHSGGTGDIFGPEFQAHRLELRTLDDYVKLYGDRPLEFEPGSKWSYSNYGFILLGVVIGKVSGQTYYDYVRDHIYQPAGMTSTGSEPEDQPVAGRSVGYTRMGGGSEHPMSTPI
ncbi:MAG TPA: serine hydrolase domain-containing protein [Gemmatimonadales bacterium]|nr:serine hydrolase domain-containing protein [Gemmatimonadales bacterium]